MLIPPRTAALSRLKAHPVNTKKFIYQQRAALWQQTLPPCRLVI